LNPEARKELLRGTREVSVVKVEGEIFEIPDERGLDKIDTLEGNGSFYLRRLDDFIELDSPNEHTAWVYYIMREMDGEARRRFSVGGNS
jgi:gamma-glutamylcyclotransferase (GGCT)/AIG2-like uncharacterized protein YtfP